MDSKPVRCLFGVSVPWLGVAAHVGYGGGVDASGLQKSSSGSSGAGSGGGVDKIKTSECSVTLDKSKVDLRLNSQVSVTPSTKQQQPPPSSSQQSQNASSSQLHLGNSSSANKGGSAAAATSAAAIVSSNSNSPSKIETKKDSPAKILPISSATGSPSSGSFGKHLKVDVSTTPSGSHHNSVNNSRSSSLEVSPVKVDKLGSSGATPTATAAANSVGGTVNSNSSGARDYSPPRVTQDVKLGQVFFHCSDFI